MIITIDGPAGAGKSTVAKKLAVRLSEQSGTPFEYLDTGSMYRAVALQGIRNRVDWEVPSQLEELSWQTRIEIDSGRTFLDGEDVTQLVRSLDVTDKTKFAADNPVIRKRMVELQRNVAENSERLGKGTVTEGRDQGTVVFPDSPCKIFLTATPEERARRRIGELEQRGEKGVFSEILADINERDARDSARKVGPLCVPENAIVFVTDGLDIETVVSELTLVALRCMKAGV